MKPERKVFVFLVLAGCFQVRSARAQDFPPTLIEKAGCILKANAYLDAARLPGSPLNPASRYDLRLFREASDSSYWDFTLPGSDYRYTNISAACGLGDYRTQTQATIRATLRQFDLYDERVTFKDLDLAPTDPPLAKPLLSGTGLRFLALKAAQSVTTPSGITITLPASAPLTDQQMNMAFNGNCDALFIPIKVTPNTKLVSPLPDSPLFNRHGRAVSIKLEVAAPNSLISYAADNTYTGLKIGISHLQTATHLDELTLIVRQRCDLQTVPISFQVPISKPTSVKTGKLR